MARFQRVIFYVYNAAGVSATVQYETVGGKTRIKTITDGAGRVYAFLYNWENEFEMVTGIKDPAGRVTTISYTGAYTVNYINFADQKKVSFSAHVNTDGATLAGDAWVFVEVWNSTNEWIVSTAFAEHTRKQ